MVILSVLGRHWAGSLSRHGAWCHSGRPVMGSLAPSAQGWLPGSASTPVPESHDAGRVLQSPWVRVSGQEGGRPPVLLLEVTPSTQGQWAGARELLLIPVSITAAPAVTGSQDAAGPDLPTFNHVFCSSSCPSAVPMSAGHCY